MKYRIKRQSSTPFDKVHEECGVFGIAAPEGKEISAAHDAYTALFALQHRGQEAAGIAVNKNGVIHCHKDVGLVSAVFDQKTLDRMPGSMAIGHVRYSTTGDTRRENAQPISITHVKGNLAVAHNGNLVNAGELRREIEDYDKECELLQGAEEPDFERLAELKSLTIKAQEELDALCAQGDPQLTMDNLARVIELWTKIPASRIREDEFRRLSELDKRLKEHIVGQDEAIEAVAAAIRRNRVGISPKHKPVSFIFVGPTGVGKTELVKQLAQDLFNSPDALIRFDMSEFMEKHSVSRIVGSPPGYVGYDEAGQLTEKIRRKPYAVILFDEIEKAHPDVMNVLLQILDDGEITDSHGRKVNFENTVIVMTSNAGSERKEGTVGFGHTVNEQNRDRAMKALGEFLRPEFLNRVDEVICFNRLDEKNFAGIARIMLDELQKSLEDKGLHFTWDEDVEDYLVKKSYSATYGARNLRRTIQKELEDVMAAQIIDSYEHPVTQIHASMEDGKLVVRSL